MCVKKTKGHSVPGAMSLLPPNGPNSWSNFTHFHCLFLSHYSELLITAFSYFYFLIYILKLFSWLFVPHLLRSSVLGRQSWGVLCLVQSFAYIGCWTNVNELCRCNLSQVCAHNGSFGLHSTGLLLLSFFGEVGNHLWPFFHSHSCSSGHMKSVRTLTLFFSRSPASDTAFSIF